MLLPALKPFTSPRFGNVVQGQKIDVPENLLTQFAAAGYIKAPNIEEDPEAKKISRGRKSK